MIRIALFVALILLPHIAMAEAYLIDKDHSTIQYEGTHDGKTFVGEFKDWRANILFDSKNLENSSIFVEINTASGDSGASCQRR